MRKMICKKCEGSLKVIYINTIFKTIIRERQCKECKEIFYTKEKIISKEEYTKLYKRVIDIAEHY